MKELKDFESDLNKCSKCGLCQSACPLYRLYPNECVVSKGKFVMLYGVTKGDLKLSKNINKYLDMCLKCGKCANFCPSGIEVCRILNTAKYEYMRQTFAGKIINILYSKIIFTNSIRLISFLGKFFRKKYPLAFSSAKNLVYFKGCVNEILPNTDKYIAKIFKNSDINIITPKFDCCGLPFLSEGNLERFIEAAKSNLELLPEDYDYLVTDCASCGSTILEYDKYLETSKVVINPEKAINWGDLIAQLGLKFKYNKPLKVTFHKPCHLKDDKFLRQILTNCDNVECVEMEDYDSCCGFAGSFAVKNFGMFNELSRQKAKNIIKTNADIVITTCPLCLLGLKHGLFWSGSRIKTMSLLEFLAKGSIV